jgi:uncharacterized protein (DUF1499 family)
MALAWLAFFDSLIAIALALAGVFAAHRGLTTPFFGFTLFALGLFFAVLALLMAIIALLIMLFSPSRRSALPRAIMGGVFALILVVPVLIVVMTHPYPAINDITTDTKNPPEFVHAQELPANHGRAMKYDPATYAQVQENAAVYHDLAPLKLDASPDDTYKKAEIIAGEVTVWNITARDQQKRTIEGVATSALFRFQDDFVIEVRPADGGGSLVEMRSKSRDGKGDLGTNYTRIKDFFRLIQGSPRGGSSSMN